MSYMVDIKVYVLSLRGQPTQFFITDCWLIDYNAHGLHEALGGIPAVRALIDFLVERFAVLHAE